MKRFLYLMVILAFAPAALAQGVYRIKPGDTLDITVLEDPNLNRSVLVRPDGGISMPVAGNIQAGGNSIEAVEKLITDRIAAGFSVSPTVSVALTGIGVPAGGGGSATVDVFFVGEISNPGTVTVKRGSTLLQALAAAGGLGQFAAERRIQLRRTDRSGHETIFLFDYKAVQNGAAIKNNLTVRAGDVIVVPERKLFE